MKAVIYHNPKCGTSRNTLSRLEDKGVDVEVVHYLKTPPSRATLQELVDRMGQGVRPFLRQRGTPFDELGLGDENLSDEALMDALESHPILLNRPVVSTELGVRVCRPPETVDEILPGGAA